MKIIAGIFLICLVIVIILFLTAPKGHEDENGFHYD